MARTIYPRSVSSCVIRGSVGVAGTLCQKRVSSCGWNMVSEEGQWV